MVPHSQRWHIQQSSNILGDCSVWQHREWGTMATAVGHLGHDVSTDIVGLLWVVSYVGICRVMHQTISDASPTRWGRASLLASELLAQQPPHQIGRCAASADSVHHEGMMRLRRWFQRRRNRGRRRLFLQHANLRIDRWWWSPLSYGRHRAPLPAFEHKTINKHTIRQD